MKDIDSIAASGVLFDGRYKLLRPLSSDGGTADVWLALDTNTIDEVYDDNDDETKALEETGIKVAIKIYRPKNAMDLGEQRFREEFKIVFNCHHTNLVQPINFSIYEGIPYLVLPFCKNGSSERLQGKITDKDALWRYIADVSSGLAYLHAFTPTIVHHDIKPANILVDDSNNYAITDFGISSHRGLNRDGYDEALSGTMAYMAPERFSDDYESTPESDVWSFGATLYELITGKVPFGEDGGHNQGESDQIPPITKPIPSDIKNLIYDCLSADKSKRPSAQEIYKAACAKKYPLKSDNRKYYMAGGLAVVLILLMALFAPKHQEKQELPVEASVPAPSNEEIFAQAMKLVESADANDLKQGLNVMDSLGNTGYVPAIYQQAYIYGWYSDSASLARKKLLDIEYYTEGKEKCLPKSQPINTKAIGLFSRIEELNDSAYPEINGKALYRLACYYVNDNKILKKDVARATGLLKNARKWAQKSNDTELLEYIDYGLDQLKN